MSSHIDFEASGRSEKVAKMVAMLDGASERLWSLHPHGDAEEIARRLRAFTDAEWLLLQGCTGNPRKKPPSEITRRLVIDTYEKRVDLAGDSDPELVGDVLDRVLDEYDPGEDV